LFLVAGLGNPGRQYAESRHNLGFMLVDRMAEEGRSVFRAVHPLYSACTVQLEKQSVVLLKPMTYMNRSGWAVALAVAAFRTSLEHCLIAYDDMAIAPGKIRLRPKGSAGGHNGVASVIEAVQSQHFPRLRLGIGPPQDDVINYVLSPFAGEEYEAVGQALSQGEAAVKTWIGQGLDKAMNRHN